MIQGCGSSGAVLRNVSCLTLLTLLLLQDQLRAQFLHADLALLQPGLDLLQALLGLLPVSPTLLQILLLLPALAFI